MNKKKPPDFEELINHERILSETPDLDCLSIILRKTKRKGTGVFASKIIRKGELICRYRLKIFSMKTYDQPMGSIYLISIYERNSADINNLVGDIFKGSFPKPINDIPFWGPFCNEPSRNQTINSDLKMNLKYIYKNKKKLKVGDVIDYEIVATKFINVGQEIVWYYGPGYVRDY